MITGLKMLIGLGLTTGFASTAVAAPTTPAELGHEYSAWADKNSMIDRSVTGVINALPQAYAARQPTSRDNRYIGDEAPR